MKYKKIRYLFVLMTLTLAFGMQSVDASENNDITLVIHKRVYKESDSIPNYNVNTGLLEDLNDDTYGLNGVVFTIYDVSDYIKDRLKTNTAEIISQEISNLTNAEILTHISGKSEKIQEITTSGVGESAGTATFSTVNATGENFAYLILETYVPPSTNIAQMSAPMLIVLPIEDPMNHGQYLNTIHLYPKGYEYAIPDPVVPKPPTKPGGNLPGTGEGLKQEIVLAYVVSGLGIMLLGISFIKKEKYKGEKYEEK